MTTIQIKYRMKDYSIADAFRSPNFGYRTYTIKTEEIGTADLREIAEIAKLEPPDDRYELFSVRALPYCDENPIIYANPATPSTPVTTIKEQ